ARVASCYHDQWHTLRRWRRQDGGRRGADRLPVRRIFAADQPQSAPGFRVTIASDERLDQPGPLAACFYRRRQIGDRYRRVGGTDLRRGGLLCYGPLLRSVAAAEHYRRATQSGLVWTTRTFADLHRQLHPIDWDGGRLRSIHCGARSARAPRSRTDWRFCLVHRRNRGSDILQSMLRPAMECRRCDKLGGAVCGGSAEPSTLKGHPDSLRSSWRHSRVSACQRGIALRLHAHPVYLARFLSRPHGAPVRSELCVDLVQLAEWKISLWTLPPGLDCRPCFRRGSGTRACCSGFSRFRFLCSLPSCIHAAGCDVVAAAAFLCGAQPGSIVHSFGIRRPLERRTIDCHADRRTFSNDPFSNDSLECHQRAASRRASL